MKRLTIHLKEFPKVKGKIFNTLSFIIKSDKEVPSILNDYKNNIKKHYITFLK